MMSWNKQGVFFIWNFETCMNVIIFFFNFEQNLYFYSSAIKFLFCTLATKCASLFIYIHRCEWVYLWHHPSYFLRKKNQFYKLLCYQFVEHITKATILFVALWLFDLHFWFINAFLLYRLKVYKISPKHLGVLLFYCFCQWIYLVFTNIQVVKRNV